MHAGVHDDHGIGGTGRQALGEDPFLIKVHAPGGVGGGGQGSNIGHHRILARDNVDHLNAVAQLVNGAIEFIRLGEDLLRARQHKTDDQRFMTGEQFTDGSG